MPLNYLGVAAARGSRCADHDRRFRNRLFLVQFAAADARQRANARLRSVANSSPSSACPRHSKAGSRLSPRSSRRQSLDTVAEGVETQAQTQFLNRVGGTCAQGYHISRLVRRPFRGSRCPRRRRSRDASDRRGIRCRRAGKNSNRRASYPERPASTAAPECRGRPADAEGPAAVGWERIAGPISDGELAERSKATVLKTVSPATGSRVRIPDSPRLLSAGTAGVPRPSW
jgi:hypothetical protein